MTGLPSPLVPADCDLRDFQFTPIEFQRLFSSETWLLANDSEKVAAITLWGSCWSQVPAGSMPGNDRLLAQLSGAGSRWKRVREIALRGWVLCDDGRYYHPVMCEKVLDAWLEKLTQRVSSAAGNAKRWGSTFDVTAIAESYMEARGLLAALSPRARSLAKQIPKTLLEAIQDGMAQDAKPPKSDRRKMPVGSPEPVPPSIPSGVPTGVPTGSQGTGTGTGNKLINSSVPQSEFSENSEAGCGGDLVYHEEFGAEVFGYEPSDAVLAELFRAGIPIALATPEVLGEFRIYWAGAMPRASPAELDAKFYQRLMSIKNRGQNNHDYSTGVERNDRKQSLSERVRRGDIVDGEFDEFFG